ncbi:membrane protein [Intrasporangium oryzae NRRL B-24470]|uniref:Membrane protein n=1 Tax=Intrasporangium oryzae NRRL B-24470 TaxID=1386089 RepID=W9G5N5_9MICO|nr:membrane protein [Intrasporangium oryzae NRRL B-24470]
MVAPDSALEPGSSIAAAAEPAAVEPAEVDPGQGADEREPDADEDRPLPSEPGAQQLETVGSDEPLPGLPEEPESGSPEEDPEPVAPAAEGPEPVANAEVSEPVAPAAEEPEPVAPVEAPVPQSEPAVSHVAEPVTLEESEPGVPSAAVTPTVETQDSEAQDTGAHDTVAHDTEKEITPAEAEPTTEPTTAPSAADEAGTAAYDATSGGVAPEPAEGHDEADAERGPVEGRAAWRRLLLMGKPRSTKANLLGALLAVALGIGIGTQVQLTNQRGLSELSQSDLVRVLDDISLRSSRLDDQIRELEATRDRLKNGTGSTAEALAQAQKRVDTLGILAGTVGAQGPGIALTISDPAKKVTGPLVLDLIQELRDAGAEAIDVGGVRVVGSSFVGDSDGTIIIDGTEISRPLMIKAIGDPKTLSSAMTIPGGIVETVRQKGARATVTELGSTEIRSLHSAPEPTNATPSP